MGVGFQRDGRGQKIGGISWPRDVAEGLLSQRHAEGRQPTQARLRPRPVKQSAALEQQSSLSRHVAGTQHDVGRVQSLGTSQPGAGSVAAWQAPPPPCPYAPVSLQYPIDALARRVAARPQRRAVLHDCAWHTRLAAKQVALEDLVRVIRLEHPPDADDCLLILRGPACAAKQRKQGRQLWLAAISLHSFPQPHSPLTRHRH
eukprot:364197-Chlamydomonas_euryale.AAC.43